MMDQGVLKSVGPALAKEQSSNEQAPLVAEEQPSSLKLNRINVFFTEKTKQRAFTIVMTS